MKKIIYTLVVGFVMVSCSGGETPPPEPAENQAPSVPTLSAPSNNLLCIDNVVAFSWNASTDPEGDAITYQVQLAKDSQFAQISNTSNTSTPSANFTLEKGVAYYWHVKATDSKGKASEFSSTYQFYTEGDGETNHLPFSPTLVAPALNATVQTATATLEWTASDVDADPLTFDVYFDTNNPPTTKVGDNQSELTSTQNLTASTTYYWKVVVKDDKGGEAIGQIWNFKTD